MVYVGTGTHPRMYLGYRYSLEVVAMGVCQNWDPSQDVLGI